MEGGSCIWSTESSQARGSTTSRAPTGGTGQPRLQSELASKRRCDCAIQRIAVPPMRQGCASRPRIQPNSTGDNRTRLRMGKPDPACPLPSPTSLLPVIPRSAYLPGGRLFALARMEQSALSIDGWPWGKGKQVIDAVVLHRARKWMVLDIGTKHERLTRTKGPRQVVQPRCCLLAAAADPISKA
jgi:hypothetical protein